MLAVYALLANTTLLIALFFLIGGFIAINRFGKNLIHLDIYNSVCSLRADIDVAWQGPNHSKSETAQSPKSTSTLVYSSSVSHSYSSRLHSEPSSGSWERLGWWFWPTLVSMSQVWKANTLKSMRWPKPLHSMWSMRLLILTITFITSCPCGSSGAQTSLFIFALIMGVFAIRRLITYNLERVWLPILNSHLISIPYHITVSRRFILRNIFLLFAKYFVTSKAKAKTKTKTVTHKE